jgi:hypothetical protein
MHVNVRRHLPIAPRCARAVVCLEREVVVATRNRIFKLPVVARDLRALALPDCRGGLEPVFKPKSLYLNRYNDSSRLGNAENPVFFDCKKISKARINENLSSPGNRTYPRRTRKAANSMERSTRVTFRVFDKKRDGVAPSLGLKRALLRGLQ